jgi:hypothetical protein
MRRSPSRLRRVVLEQCDLQVTHAINDLAVGRKPAVRDAEHQFGTHHALDVDAVDQLLHGRQHLAGELDLAGADRAAAARGAGPAEKKADHLPQGVEPEAARHHRVALEVTGEKPEIRPHVENRPDQALAVLAAGLGDLRDAVEHQHWRQGKLRPAVEEFPAPTSKQVLVLEARAARFHQSDKSPGATGGLTNIRAERGKDWPIRWCGTATRPENGQQSGELS